MSKLPCSYKKWHLQSISNPFELYKLDNVFNKGFIRELRRDLLKLPFEYNANDMFSFRQTCDLYNLENTSNSSNLITLVLFLKSFREFLMKLFSISLKEQISVSGSMYKKGDYLLCHDDKLDDRYIAFILYLNSDWSEEWGGSLDLFNRKNNGQPFNVAYSMFPEYNRLLFFKVGDDTYHQVSEVLSDVSRLTINGWFHAANVCTHAMLPALYEKLIPFSAVTSLPEGLSLDLIVNDFGGTLVTLPKRMNKSKFLTGSVYSTIKAELCSEQLNWEKIGPPNLRRYYYTKDVVNFHMTKMLHDIFVSNEMAHFLKTLMDIEDLSENLMVHIEFQKWTPSCYLMANGQAGQQKFPFLDVFLFFGVSRYDKNDDDDNEEEEGEDIDRVTSCSGNIYYACNSSSPPIHELRPKNNVLYVVERDEAEYWFVNYISHLVYTNAYYVMHASYFSK